MDQRTYKALDAFCISYGLKRGQPNGAYDVWETPDGSLTCSSGAMGGFMFGSACLIRFDSTDGSYGVIMVDSSDASVLDAKQAKDGSHKAVDAAYAAKDAINAQLNPPLPDDANRSAH